jgi:glucose/arabinose dehydrogenase/mono/diheme cytochrome c family protein
MQRSLVASVICKLLFLCLLPIWVAQPKAQPAASGRREANTTLRLSSAPPVVDYSTTDALSGLAFNSPVALASPPGDTNRLFVVERTGRIIVITNLFAPTRTVFLDISDRVNSEYKTNGLEGLASVVFHPGYAANRLFYVVYTLSNRSGKNNRLSRFESSPSNPNIALADSEMPLLTQKDEGYGHNWNDLHFGADGYLYMAIGDEGDAQDQYQNSERIDKDYFSGILRIDVDKRPGSLPPNPHPATTSNYAVPPDNPFIGATSFHGVPVNPSQVRTEFYAVGLRNPWRISFDPVTGYLYCGDVGQHAVEEIDVIVKGGDYGWAYREGSAKGFRGDPPAGVSFIPPILEYKQGFGDLEGKCVIGGVVYRGARIPQLQGAYVFGDYVSGNIWALRYDGSKTTSFQRLTADGGIAGFGFDPRNGDVLMADHDEGKIKRLEYHSASTGSPVPLTLAETGAFRDLATLTPQPGIIAYDINVPFWSDNARKRRWFSVPDPTQTIGFDRLGSWSFPPGTVWIKHFELELTKGVPQSARRLETRFLIRNANGLLGVTYRWDESQSNATLVPESGLDEQILVQDSGITRTQVWHYPSRNECLVCHTSVAGHVLGFNTAQLNRDFDHGGVTNNQIQMLSDAGYFGTNIGSPQSWPALALPDASAHSLEYRVRSYLAANCAQCHLPGGIGNGFFDARLVTPTSAAGLINGTLQNLQRIPQNRVVKPGSPELSMLLKRISTLGEGRMPPLASSVLDKSAIDLLTAWIAGDLVRYESFEEWQVRYFGSTNSSAAAALADADQDGAANRLEYLTSQNPLSAAEVWKIDIRRNGSLAQIVFPQLANRGFEVQSTFNLADATSWRPLDVFENRPFFSATNRIGLVGDITTNAAVKFYRVRVFEP